MSTSSDELLYRHSLRGYGTHQAVVELVPPDAHVLDVGCASGYLLSAFRDERNARCIGVEPDPRSAAVARAAGFQVVNSIFDQSTADELVAQGPFDRVVFADVLEHMVDPAAALRCAAGLLTPDGAVIVSLPNIAFLTARLRLARGVFRYEDTGIFDRTHLRFFTVETAHQLAADAGFDVREVQYVGPATHRGGRRGLKLNRLWPGLLAFQMVFLLAPRDGSGSGT